MSASVSTANWNFLFSAHLAAVAVEEKEALLERKVESVLFVPKRFVGEMKND